MSNCTELLTGPKFNGFETSLHCAELTEPLKEASNQWVRLDSNYTESPWISGSDGHGFCNPLRGVLGRYIIPTMPHECMSQVGVHTIKVGS